MCSPFSQRERGVMYSPFSQREKGGGSEVT